MKKIYKTPSSRSVSLHGESLMNAGSLTSQTSDTSVVGQNAMTQKQDFINTPWDDWSE